MEQSQRLIAAIAENISGGRIECRMMTGQRMKAAFQVIGHQAYIIKYFCKLVHLNAFNIIEISACRQSKRFRRLLRPFLFWQLHTAV